jgi:hypothetical protein
MYCGTVQELRTNYNHALEQHFTDKENGRDVISSAKIGHETT